MTTHHVFDPAGLLQRVGGNRALFTELVEIFIDEGPHHLEMVREGLRQNDPGKVRLGSHTLKGSLSYFGIPLAIESAERLEKLGRAGTLQEAAPIFDQLDNLVRSLVEELKQPIP